MNNSKLLKHFGSRPIVWTPAWGISKLRRRGGIFPANICGKARYYDQWYARAMSETMAAKLADIGVNLIVLPFSLGGSTRGEQAERDDFERMTVIYHRLGVKVLPYFQYQNFLQEEHVPPPETLALDADGKPIEYAYWRKTVCQSQPIFKDYLKGLTADAIRRGADGVWIDNTYVKPCYCQSCREVFRQWLRQNREFLLEELYLEHFDHVDMPPPGLLAHRPAYDPMVQAFIEFSCDRNLGIHRELKAHLESMSPDGLYTGNIGLFRGATNSHKGVDFKALVELHDLFYLENNLFPRWKHGQLSGNHLGFAAGQALGIQAIPGAWQRDNADDLVDEGTEGMPANRSECERVVFEAISHDGVPGFAWMVRAREHAMCDCADDLLKLYVETPEIERTLRRAYAWSAQLPVFGAGVNPANIAILQHRECLLFDYNRHGAALHGISDVLLRNGIPWKLAFSEELDVACARCDALVLPEVRLLSDADTARLVEFVVKGGFLMLLGNGGLYDERFRDRLDYALCELPGVTVFDRSQGWRVHPCGRGRVAFLPSPVDRGDTPRAVNQQSGHADFRLPAWHAEAGSIREHLVTAMGERLQARIVQPETVAVTLRNGRDGTRAVHLFNAHKESVQDVTVILAARDYPAKARLWRYPDEETHVEGKIEGAFVHYAIQPLSRYALMLFD